MHLRTENCNSTLKSFLISQKRTVNIEIDARNDITADYITIMLRTLKVTGNLVKLELFVLLPVSEEAKAHDFHFFRSMYSKTFITFGFYCG